MKEQVLLFKEDVYAIIGAAIEVHKQLGPGFLEKTEVSAFQQAGVLLRILGG